MIRSRYDELHDRFERIATTKAGTRYERLAALVFKCFNSRQVVIHDLKLAGSSGVKHQIDVQIEVDGRSRHLLVECKDFDVLGAKVGLEIVRNFWAVMDDTGPDEGIIISCNGFTKPAQKYAKAKGIKLAVLRDFREADWENRIRTIEVVLNIGSVINPQVHVHAGSEERRQHVQSAFADAGIDVASLLDERRPVFLIEEGTESRLSTRVREQIDAFPKQTPGPAELTIQPEDLQLRVGDSDSVPIQKLRVTFVIAIEQRRMFVRSHMIAELLLAGFGDSDFVVFDDDLNRYLIDPTTGEVRPRNG